MMVGLWTIKGYVKCVTIQCVELAQEIQQIVVCFVKKIVLLAIQQGNACHVILGII